MVNWGKAVYISANKITPTHEGLELGIGDASIVGKALAEVCGSSDKDIKKCYDAEGDLGIVAQSDRSLLSMMFKPASLTVTKVFNTFRTLAKESGKDSQEKKKNHMKSLLVAATDCEPKYLTRLLQGKLRIGLAEQTLLAALGQAAVYTEEHSKPPLEFNLLWKRLQGLLNKCTLFFLSMIKPSLPFWVVVFGIFQKHVAWVSWIYACKAK